MLFQQGTVQGFPNVTPSELLPPRMPPQQPMPQPNQMQPMEQPQGMPGQSASYTGNPMIDAYIKYFIGAE